MVYSHAYLQRTLHFHYLCHLKGNSGVKMNFFHVKGLIFSWRFLLVVRKNCVRDFRISMLK